jgi:hypothetical protein
MQIPLSKNVVMSIMVVCLLTFVAHGAIMLISILVGCNFLSGYTRASSTFPSFASFCVTYSSIVHCFTPSSLSNSWMYTRSTSVALGLACLFELQPLLHLHNFFTIDALDLYISWIMECANYIFSWYYFPSSCSKDDDECNGDLTTNTWMFNIPTLYYFFNYSSISSFLNTYASFSCFHLCSLLYASFSLDIFCNFSIALFTFMFLQVLELRKNTQLLVINKITFDTYLVYFCPQASRLSHSFFEFPTIF